MNWDSSGLMPQIQALIAFPPGSMSSNKNKTRSHPYYKKPGRSHNHDTCDACSQAGDLLCCDTCVASFHLLCINPPLSYEQLPAGGWRCHRCKSTQTQPEQSSKSKTSRRTGKKRSAPISTSTIKPPDVPLKKSLMDSSTTPDDKRILANEGNVVEKFFQKVVDIARKMNPEQYQLPKEFMNYGAQQFPGAPRPVVKKQQKANKQVIEMENGMVPNPCVLCFVCDTSCRKGPMIRCDSCSACFHFDCLNPPLTGVPQGRWRCQLHTEQVLEQKVLKSLSLTERVALYDKSKQPFDPIQAALNFVTKSQRAKYYYFRSKIPHRGKNPTKIPGAVVQCYASNSSDDEDDSLPAWPDINGITNHKYPKDHSYEKARITEGTTPLKLLADVATMEILSSQKLVKQVGEEQIRSSNKNGSSEQLQQLHNENDSNIVPPKENSESSGPKVEQRLLLELKSKSNDGGLKEPDDDLLEGLDLKTIRSLAACKLRELRSDETIESSVSDTEGNETPPRLASNPNSVRNPKSSLSNSIINDKLSSTVNGIEIEEKLPEGIREEQLEIPLPFITLQILNSNKEIKFEGESFTIGRGEQNDLDLREHSNCTTPVDEHCVIFYDYVCATWELVNYSPDGTFVNHCLYGCDGDKINRKKLNTTNNKKKSNPLQEIVDPTYERFSLKSVLQSKIDARLKKRKDCPCTSLYCKQKEVWEGGAKLFESTRIQIGCVKMVVSEIGCEGKLITVPVQDPYRKKSETSKRKKSKEEEDDNDDDDDEDVDIKEEPNDIFTSLPRDTDESDKESKVNDGIKIQDDNNDNNNNDGQVSTSTRTSRPRKKIKTLKVLESEESYATSNATTKATTRGRRGRGVGSTVSNRRKRNSGGQSRAAKAPSKRISRGGRRKSTSKKEEEKEKEEDKHVDEDDKVVDTEKQQEQEENEQKQENLGVAEVVVVVEKKEEEQQEGMDTNENQSIEASNSDKLTTEETMDVEEEESGHVPPTLLADHDYVENSEQKEVEDGLKNEVIEEDSDVVIQEHVEEVVTTADS